MRRLALVSVGFVLAIVVTLLVLREPTEPLTRAGLAEARQKWRAAGIDDYTLRFRMLGSEYDVTARGGIVVGATVDGRTPQGVDLGAYGVKGLFDTLELELDNLDDPAGPFAGRTETVVMRVRFHPTLGYVERYLRSAGGYGPSVTIELIEFNAR